MDYQLLFSCWPCAGGGVCCSCAGAAGGTFFSGAVSAAAGGVASGPSTERVADFREEMIINRRVSTMNRMANTVVNLDKKVADPRGPKVDWLPAPPNAPARSALFPLCSKTTTFNSRLTTIRKNNTNPSKMTSYAGFG